MIGEIVGDFAVSVTLRRRGTGVRVLGRYTPAVPVETPISAAIVPASGHDLLRLPEGRRNEETIRVFVEANLSADKNAPDEIVYRGAVWEVANVRDWQDQGAFSDALATRKAPTEGESVSTLANAVHNASGTSV